MPTKIVHDCETGETREIETTAEDDALVEAAAADERERRARADDERAALLADADAVADPAAARVLAHLLRRLGLAPEGPSS